MDYIPIRDAAEKWGISTRRIQVLCNQGRIPGAERMGYAWAIPRTAEKPSDARIRNGRYINKRRSSVVA